MRIDAFFIRSVDLSVAVLLILMLLPLWVIIIPILRVTGEGDVFYRQIRVGKGGKRFGLLKFATMLRNSALVGSGEVTLRDDPRVLPIGRFLRKTKLNEIPQLFNILLGDMSFVGWRPQTPRYYEAYSDDVKCTIGKTRPGLSGIGSIIFRDEESILSSVRNPVEFDFNVIVPYKGRLEVWYAERASLSLYVQIVLLTIWVVVLPNSRAVWRVFDDLPEPPGELNRMLIKPAMK